MQLLFDISHYIVCCSMLKDDFPNFADDKDFSHLNPVASWIGSMMLCFSEDIFGNVCIGESPLSPVTKTVDILWATAVWYIMNFCPYDLVYTGCSSTPVALIIWTIKELDRTSRISRSVTFAKKYYPNSNVAIFITANLKGSGAAHMQLLQRLVAGEWMPSHIDTLRLSITTKVTAYAVASYMMQSKGLLPISEETHFNLVAFCLIVVRAFALLNDFYLLALAEDLVCYIFLGGIIDWLFGVNARRVSARKSTIIK